MWPQERRQGVAGNGKRQTQGQAGMQRQAGSGAGEAQAG